MVYLWKLRDNCMLLLTECYTLNFFHLFCFINVLLHLASMSLGLPWSVTLCQSFWFCMTLTVLNTGQVPDECPLLDSSDVFLLVWVWGKSTTKVKSSSHHVRGYKYPRDITDTKVFSITNHCRNVDEKSQWSHSTPLEWLLYFKKKITSVRLWRNWNPCALLVGL